MKEEGPQEPRDAHEAARFAVVPQLLILLFSSLILDGGQIARFCGAAIVVHWIAAAIILIRRPRRPTPFDIILLRAGFFLILAVAFTVAIIATFVAEVLNLN